MMMVSAMPLLVASVPRLCLAAAAQPSSSSSSAPTNSQISHQTDTTQFVGRRGVVNVAAAAAVLACSSVGISASALARERRRRKEIPLDDFLTASDGLKFFDILEGRGLIAEKGKTVLVHFDCVFRGITAISSRESKLLGGNRIISQPYEFVVGSVPGRERKSKYVENANGLFSAQAAPKPPPALYSVSEGMRVGGKRTVIVPPENGYGSKGLNEIPPGATFEMNIELLEVK